MDNQSQDNFKAIADELIRVTLMQAAANTADPEIVAAMLAPKASVSPAGTVTVGNKSPQDAVADLLKLKPMLAGTATDTGLQAAYQQAKQAGDVPAMMRLKSQMGGSVKTGAV